MKEGAIFGAVIALLLGIVIVGINGCNASIEAQGRAQAAAIYADGQRSIDQAISRQMDAATAAVIRDTHAAHSATNDVILLVALGVVVTVTGGALTVAVWCVVKVSQLADENKRLVGFYVMEGKNEPSNS